jgi:hypothetical protein
MSSNKLNLVALAASCVAVAVLMTRPARAGVTPESPEVQKLVANALQFLEKNEDPRSGAKMLVGLAFLKAGKRDNSRVVQAIDECRKMVKANAPNTELDVYTNGIAIILLCEASPQKYAKEIDFFLNRLKARQKPHGGWGYETAESGDTSQTQYGALSYWEAHRHGFKIDAGSVDRLADWLVRTQAPDGAWGYQGIVAKDDEPVPQTEVSNSLLAAGMGASYICADLFGMRPVTSQTMAEEAPQAKLPAALRPVTENGPIGEPQTLHPQKMTAAKLYHAIDAGHGWMTKNYKIDIGDRRFYYLYGLERYKSFQEMFNNIEDKSPQWYNDGYEYLAKNQNSDGSWQGYCGMECDTAFSTLFLIRSTQKSIRAKLGEGMLLAGRGLPTNLARAKLRNGELIVDQVHTKVDELLNMIDDGDATALDDLASDPSQIVVEQVDDKSGRRLQQLVRGGEAGARLLAVRALGRTGNLDYVPTLLYALTDPDRRVVLEARNELRFISRNFDGIGPPDDFTDEQRFQAIAAWKKWYKSIRPTAILEE